MERLGDVRRGWLRWTGWKPIAGTKGEVGNLRRVASCWTTNDDMAEELVIESVERGVICWDTRRGFTVGGLGAGRDVVVKVPTFNVGRGIDRCARP